MKEYAGRYGIEKETQERIRRMVWVSLMECVKQEVRRIGEVPRKTVKKQIESYCGSELVKDAVNGLDAGKFGTAQRDFFVGSKRTADRSGDFTRMAAKSERIIGNSDEKWKSTGQCSDVGL